LRPRRATHDPTNEREEDIDDRKTGQRTERTAVGGSDFSEASAGDPVLKSARQTPSAEELTENSIPTAIISDGHANPEALQAVLEDIDARGLTDIVCLGDVVGYGPNPRECADIVRRRCRFTIRGNHEDALVAGAEGFNPFARKAIDWTREELRRSDP